MRNHALAVGLMMLCASGAARADWLPKRADSPLHTGPTVDIGYTFGGENLNRDSLARKDPGGTTYLSGEGFSGGLGMVETFGDSGFALKEEGGYWAQYNFIDDIFGGQPLPGDPNLNFGHTFVDALVLYHWDDEQSMSSVGIGMTYQSKIELHGSRHVQTDFQNTPGLIVQYQAGAVTFRYTAIRYRVKGNNSVSISGSNFGIYLTLTWSAD